MTFNYKNTAALLNKATNLRPTLGMVLGSGFQHALSELDISVELPFSQLPGFPSVGVSGHAGKLIIGKFGETPVIVLKGRAHYYEGYEMDRITFPIRVMAEFGVETLLLTNAAGALRRSFKPGNFMVFQDHINLMGKNPLRGPSPLGINRFVDCTRVYDEKLRQILKKAGSQAKLKMAEGVYLAISGPSYETPAEIRAFGRLGADAVGMSTVPEAIVARQCGLRVAAVSCITNMAAGISGQTLSHQDVLDVAGSKRNNVSLFLGNFAVMYGKSLKASR
ncbi:MAG: pupG [Verrucomicrobiales bacterium]|jgi:purine-nucleoside phosphorylase|nr:pupG [Verrucomicrobiales bacterium]MDB6128966.1 pupG [Verrucomicrobiales bacterium]